ncbi:MAG: type II secretion system protein GspI [Xanthomonadaceae bacterium]|nr:type II secretion system protein GspI [Xanthomonadaceae bacterium]
MAGACRGRAASAHPAAGHGAGAAPPGRRPDPDRTLATWLARNQVLEVQLQGEWPQPGQASGALEYAGREWRWRQRITQTPEADMRRLDLEVWLPGAEGEPLARLTGFLERP